MLNEKITRKEFIKKVGLGILLTPLLIKAVSAKTLFKGDSINLQDLTVNEIVATNNEKELITLSIATYPSLTELSYVKGVTSSIQDQINNKLESSDLSYIKKDNITFGLIGNTTGIKQYAVASYPFTIKSWRIVSESSGDVVIDVWKANGSKPTSSAQSICGSEKPTLSSSDLASDTDLTTWTTSVSAGDVLVFNVDSISAVNKFTMIMEIEK